MTVRNMLAAGIAVLALAGTSTVAMAQATSKENNATTGSQPGVGPASGMEDKGTPGSSDKMKGSSGSMEMKNDTPTSAGTADEQSKGLRGHSEMPTTGK